DSARCCTAKGTHCGVIGGRVGVIGDAARKGQSDSCRRKKGDDTHSAKPLDSVFIDLEFNVFLREIKGNLVARYWPAPNPSVPCPDSIQKSDPPGGVAGRSVGGLPSKNTSN